MPHGVPAKTAAAAAVVVVAAGVAVTEELWRTNF